MMNRFPKVLLTLLLTLLLALSLSGCDLMVGTGPAQVLVVHGVNCHMLLLLLQADHKGVCV